MTPKEKKVLTKLDMALPHMHKIQAANKMAAWIKNLIWVPD
jgi:hypothetical protein